MKPIVFSEILSNEEYEKVRNDFRKQIFGLKRGRRILVGEKITLVFENRETLIYQIQEMVRAERMVDKDQIQNEIDAWNKVVPKENELTASLSIQVLDNSKIEEELKPFVGLDQGVVQLEIDSNVPVTTKFHKGLSGEDWICKEHHLSFTFDPDRIEALQDFENQAVLAIVHPNYWRKAKIPNELRQILIEDLKQD